MENLHADIAPWSRLGSNAAQDLWTFTHSQKKPGKGVAPVDQHALLLHVGQQLPERLPELVVEVHHVEVTILDA